MRKRKPAASSNTSAYIIHGSRLIGAVKGPHAPRINGCAARPKNTTTGCCGGNLAVRRLAVGLPWLKLEPCSPNTRRAGGIAERPSINGAHCESHMERQMRRHLARWHPGRFCRHVKNSMQRREDWSAKLNCN